MNNFQNQVQGNPYGPQMPQKPDNYLVWAILSTLLCCLPFGIVAIVKSSKVDSLWYAGNHAEAIQASNDAKKMVDYFCSCWSGRWSALCYTLCDFSCNRCWCRIDVILAKKG